MLFKKISATLLSLFFVCSCISSETAMKQSSSILTCQINGQAEQSLNDGIWLNYQVTNHSKQAIQLLTWLTPIEGMLTNLFTVKNTEGQKLLYQGPMMKRGQPSDSDFITINPEKTHTSKINLMPAYPLKAGQYKIRLNAKYLTYKTLAGKEEFIECPSNTISINVSQ